MGLGDTTPPYPCPPVRAGFTSLNNQRQGESRGQHLPFTHSQNPLADLATGLRLSLRKGWGWGGCSLGPERRRQEVLCVCSAPETPVLPPACLWPPSLLASLCAALFILQPWQPGPACSQCGAPAAPASTCPVLAALEAAGQAQSPCC